MKKSLQPNKLQKSRKRRLEIRRLRSSSSPSTLRRRSTDGGGRENKYCCKGGEETSSSKIKNTSSIGELLYGHISMMGRRRVMEDALSMGRIDGEEYSYSYFGVYGGDKVAEPCSKRLHNCLENHIQKYMEKHRNNMDWEKVVAAAFRSMDDEIEELDEKTDGEKKTMKGSSAALVLVSPEEVVVANCGGSRVLLCRDGAAVALSSNHKWDGAEENEMRVEGSGQMILNWNNCSIHGVHTTSTSSAGNHAGVTCEPVVTVTKRTGSDDLILIIATDGLWDVLGNNTVFETAKNCISRESCGPSKAATKLAQMAIARGSRDNITIIVVHLIN